MLVVLGGLRGNLETEPHNRNRFVEINPKFSLVLIVYNVSLLLFASAYTMELVNSMSSVFPYSYNHNDPLLAEFFDQSITDTADIDQIRQVNWGINFTSNLRMLQWNRTNSHSPGQRRA